MLEAGLARVERELANRADVEDPGRRRRSQQRQEQPGEQHRRQVVDGEPELMTVRAQLPSLSRRAKADGGVVDQDVEPRRLRADLGRQVRDLAEHGQVGDKAPGAAAELGGQAGHPYRITSVGEDLPAGARELPGQVPAKPGGSPGDQHDRCGVSHLSSSSIRLGDSMSNMELTVRMPVIPGEQVRP
jgi:hypothetical protein